MNNNIKFYNGGDEVLSIMGGSGRIGIGTGVLSSPLSPFMDEGPRLEEDPDLDDVGHRIIGKAW